MDLVANLCNHGCKMENSREVQPAKRATRAHISRNKPRARSNNFDVLVVFTVKQHDLIRFGSRSAAEP